MNFQENERDQKLTNLAPKRLPQTIAGQRLQTLVPRSVANISQACLWNWVLVRERKIKSILVKGLSSHDIFFLPKNLLLFVDSLVSALTERIYLKFVLARATLWCNNSISTSEKFPCVCKCGNNAMSSNFGFTYQMKITWQTKSDICRWLHKI